MATVNERQARRAGAGSVASASFTPLTDRRSVLDRAHRGDILGALGRVQSFDTAPRRSLRRRVATLFAIMGPGVVVLLADNDAGGLSIYAQAGQDHGLRLLWLVVVLAPVLFVNQEMAARLGAVTGAGHARLIFERFGRRWGGFALADLLVLNFLTIVTEFIGIALGLGYFGVSRYVSVPIAAALLVAVTGTGSFRRWERVMYALAAVSFVCVPFAVLARAHHPAAQAAPRVADPLTGGALLFVVALIGTTVAPWQLFFQQSNVVDKRITARWLGYERVDTLIGTIMFTIGAAAVLAGCAFVFRSTPWHGGFSDAGRTAAALRSRAGPWVGALFAIAVVNGSVFGAGAVTLSTSYALGDAFGTKHSLHRRWKQAPVFHGSFAALVVLAGAVVLVPGAPLGLATIAVQALAGILLPSATVFLLLLCNDTALLGPRTNPRWLNALASAVVGTLIVLSALLTVSTLFPHLDPAVVAATLAIGAGGVGIATFAVLTAPRPRTTFAGTHWDRTTWTTPPLETIPPPERSRARTFGLVVLRSYLLLAGALTIVKIVRLMVGV